MNHCAFCLDITPPTRASAASASGGWRCCPHGKKPRALHRREGGPRADRGDDGPHATSRHPTRCTPGRAASPSGSAGHRDALTINAWNRIGVTTRLPRCPSANTVERARPDPAPLAAESGPLHLGQLGRGLGRAKGLEQVKAPNRLASTSKRVGRERWRSSALPPFVRSSG